MGLVGFEDWNDYYFFQIWGMVQWDKEWLKRDVMALRAFNPRCFRCIPVWSSGCRGVDFG